MKGKLDAKAEADCKAGNPNSEMLLLSKDQSEFRVSKAWGYSLISEAECAPDLIACGSFANFSSNVLKGFRMGATQEIGIRVYEGLTRVKTDGDYVHGVLHGKFVCFF